MVNESVKKPSLKVGINNLPKDLILCSGYEIERKDIVECKNFDSSTDPLMQKDLSANEHGSASPDLVTINYQTADNERLVLKFNDFSISDEKSICWSNRCIWILRAPVKIYQARGYSYIVLSQKHTAPPSLHIRFKMNLTEELTSFNNDNKSSEDSSTRSVNLGFSTSVSRISLVEKEVFKSVCLNLELYYTLFLCCPRNIISKSPIASSTQKVLLIDDSHNPVRALNCVKYLVKNTCNKILILLLADEAVKKQPKKKKKNAGSESEKRLDFDEDLKGKSLLRLESFVNANPNSVVLVSQADDKNYLETFEETARSFTGAGGFECAVDFR